MYELLTGQRAHNAQNPHDMLASVRAGRIAPPSALRPGTPPALEQVLMAALHPDPAARPATARQMMGVLQNFSANLPAFIQRLLPIQAAASVHVSVDTLRQRAAMRRQSLVHWRLKSLLAAPAPAPVEPPVSRPSLPSASAASGFGERPLSSPAVMAASPLSKSLSLKLSALIPPPNNNGESSTQAIDISALGILDDDAAAPRTQPISAVPVVAPTPTKTPAPAPAEEEPASSTRAIDISALGVLDEDRKADALSSILKPTSPPPASPPLAQGVAAEVPESSTRAIDIDSLGILDEDRSSTGPKPRPPSRPPPCPLTLTPTERSRPPKSPTPSSRPPSLSQNSPLSPLPCRSRRPQSLRPPPQPTRWRLRASRQHPTRSRPPRYRPLQQNPLMPTPSSACSRPTRAA